MDILVEFVENTIVSLTCGCVSLVTIAAICSFAVFFAFDVVPRAFPTKEPSKYASYFRVVKKVVRDEADDVDDEEEEIIEKKTNNLTVDECQYAENDAVTPIKGDGDDDDEREKNCDFGCSFCQAAIAIGMYGVATVGNGTIYGDGIDSAPVDHLAVSSTTTTPPATTATDDTIATYVDEYEVRHSWRCNWLFRETKRNREYKKRRLRGGGGGGKTAAAATAAFPIAVPMLVPNPSTCTYRALIGDLDVDETSDLSSDELSASISGDGDDGDNNNNDDDDDIDVGIGDDTSNRNDELVEAKNIEYIYKYNVQHSSLLPPSINASYHRYDRTRVDSEDDHTVATSIEYIDLNDGCDSCGEYESYDHRISPPLLASYARRLKSRSANNQKTSSANKYDKCYDRQLDSGEGGSLEESSSSEVDQDSQFRCSINNGGGASTINDRPTNNSDNDPSNESVRKDEPIADARESTPESESESERLSCPPKPGTIAEREHSKWEQAAPMPNNPYTEESIRKRNIENIFFPSACVDRESYNPAESCRENGGDFIDGDNSLSKYRKEYYVNQGLSVSIVSNDNITVYDTTCRDGKKMAQVDSTDDEEKTTTSQSQSQSTTPTSSLVRVSSWSERRGVRSRWSENDADSVIGRQNGTRSVKELAKQFSQYATTIKTEDTATLDKYPNDKFSNSVHSLTARSVSKQFREELKNRTTPTFNRNVHVFVSSPPASLTQSAAISE